jgi:hypothetical protein
MSRSRELRCIGLEPRVEVDRPELCDEQRSPLRGCSRDGASNHCPASNTSTQVSSSFQNAVPSEGVECTVLFWRTKNTWFSASLDSSVVFCWFSAFSPTLCTVVSKKTKVSCFADFFPFGFLNQATGYRTIEYRTGEF